MRNKQILLSGRAVTTNASNVPADRYSFLHLSDAEPNLGVASANDYVLVYNTHANTSGNRLWSKSLITSYDHANSAYDSQNTTGVYANAAFLKANSAYGSQNTTGTYANAAYAQANSASLYANGAFVQANAAYGSQNTTGTYANAAFLKANSAYASQNTTGTYANAAYAQANSASLYANGAFVQANAAYGSQNTTGTYANAAFLKANSAYAQANSASLYANGAFIQSNAAYAQANSASLYANGAFVQANAAYGSQNTTGTYANAAFLKANSAYDSQNVTGTYANNAYLRANNSLNANVGGTVTGNVTIIGNLSSNILTTTGSGGDITGANAIFANYIFASNIDLHLLANAAYAQANSASLYANGAFVQANASYGSQNVTGVYANAAYAQANSASLYANGAFVQSNAAYGSQNTTGVYANSAYASQNVTGTYANSAYVRANNSLNANVGGTVTGAVTVQGDFSVLGNVFVIGNTFSVSAGTIVANDSLLVLGANNYYNDVLDIGFASHYNDGVNAHSGLIRDATNKEWYLFKGYIPELSPNNNIIVTDPSFTIDTLNANLKSGLITLRGVEIGYYANAAYNSQNTTGVYANAAFLKANSAYGSQNVTGTYANNAYLHANSGFIHANSAFETINNFSFVANSTNVTVIAVNDHANAAFLKANAAYASQNVTGTYANAAFAQANSAALYANGAFIVANTADDKATSAGVYANGAFLQANSAYASQNVTGTYANNSYAQANSASLYANGAFIQANAAYGQVNSISSYANAAFLKANSAYESQNTTGVYANNAFIRANNSLDANVGGIVTGNVTVTQNLTVTGNISVSGNLFTSIPANGNTSAYATKYLVEYNPVSREFSYSSTPNASNPYITGYSSEIHVSPVAFNDSGKGTIGDPVKTIARAKELLALAFETTGVGQRKTIILHPGDYAEDVTIDTQFTVLTSHELIGKSTTLTGTLTLTKGCTIDGLKMTNLVISATSADGTVDLIGCTVTTAVTKTSSAYTVLRGCDLSSATLSVTGAGNTILIGGNYGSVTVNNASAGVLAKTVITMGPTTLTAGTLQIADTIVYSATNSSNAITQSAGSVLTLNNSQILIPTLTNVARVNLGGFYSILHSVYDKANSALSGTSLNAISYSQYINADKVTLSSGGSLVFPDSTIQITAAAPYAYSNASYLHANAAFNVANNSIDTYVRTHANASYNTANAAFVKANAAVFTITANSYEIYTNTSTGNIQIGLANVNASIGTYGGATAIPVINVDGYGRVQSVSNTTITVPPGTYIFPNTGQLTTNSNFGNVLIGLANVNSTIGTFGGASVIPIIQTDGYGRITNIVNSSISIPSGTNIVNSSFITANSPNGNVALSFANSGVTAGTYGGGGSVPVITVDQYGRITVASNTASSTNALSTIIRNSYTATAAQTAFNTTTSFTPGYADVYVNGLKLSPADYTANPVGSINILNPTLIDGDAVDIQTATTFIVDANTRYEKTTFTATAGQTAFTVSYVVGSVNVYLNGLRLKETDDFVATNGSTVTLTVACELNDIVEIERSGMMYTYLDNLYLSTRYANTAISNGQTTFTVTGGYKVGFVDVFLNGIKLNIPSDVLASDGTTVVMQSAIVETGDIIEVIGIGPEFTPANAVSIRGGTVYGSLSVLNNVNVTNAITSNTLNVSSANITSNLQVSYNITANAVNVATVYFNDGTQMITAASGSGTGITWKIISANTTANTTEGFLVDTTTANVYITLNSSPSLGNTARIVDMAGNFAINNCIIKGNGSKVMGSTDDFIISSNNAGIGLVYSNATYGWRIIENP